MYLQDIGRVLKAELGVRQYLNFAISDIATTYLGFGDMLKCEKCIPLGVRMGFLDTRLSGSVAVDNLLALQTVSDCSNCGRVCPALMKSNTLRMTTPLKKKTLFPVLTYLYILGQKNS